MRLDQTLDLNIRTQDAVPGESFVLQQRELALDDRNSSITSRAQAGDGQAAARSGGEKEAGDAGDGAQRTDPVLRLKRVRKTRVKTSSITRKNSAKRFLRISGWRTSTAE